MRMAGVNIGKVKQKELGPGGRSTVVTMEINHHFAPIGRDAKAITSPVNAPLLNVASTANPRVPQSRLAMLVRSARRARVGW